MKMTAIRNVLVKGVHVEEGEVFVTDTDTATRLMHMGKAVEWTPELAKAKAKDKANAKAEAKALEDQKAQVAEAQAHARAEWEGSQDLRDQFETINDYLAYLLLPAVEVE